MNTVWDVLRRLVESRPMNELEQRLAHDIITAHETAAAGDPTGSASPADAPGDAMTPAAGSANDKTAANAS